MPAARIRIDHFTDPACPWAFSAEPDLLALRWFYGEQLEWWTQFVVLSEKVGDSEAKGMTLELMMAGDEKFVRRFEMPINAARRPHLLVARGPDLLAKAVQLYQPDLAERVLRALRVAWQTDHRPIDDPSVALDVAAEVGVDRAALEQWLVDPAVDAALRADMQAARSPLPPALGPLDHKLAGPPERRRYTCPSLVFSTKDDPARVLVAPGFQSLGAYEVILANLDPGLKRAAPASDPLAVLRWADWPLASVEVARVMGTETAAAAAALAEAGASDDRGYWSIAAT